MNYYERHIGDYLKDTSHLSLLEHGVYCRLMDVYYTRECGIDASDAARLIGARSKDEKAALESVLREFFELVGGIYVQGRCDAEIARFQDKQRKAKASANSRWSHSERNANASKTHVQTECEPDANALRTHCEGNAPNNQTPDTSNQTPNTKPPNPPTGGEPDGFAEFWSAYPRKTAKPAALRAFRAQRVNGKLPDILADVERRKTAPEWAKDGGQFIPHPATYLTQRRWEDGPEIGQISPLIEPAKPPKSESFAERDRRAGMERWEQMTGRKHPELERLRGSAGAEIIDSMPLERIEHGSADQSH